jgi:serine/threonine-protein kinase RsbW
VTMNRSHYSEKQTFPASIDHLHEILAWIIQAAQEKGFSDRDLYQIELASEEAIVNVIQHSYRDLAGDVSIEIQSFDHELHISISDCGRPFNPLVGNPKTPDTSLEQRPIGGLGILFIRKCMDSAAYQRKENQNILTLTKRKSTGI